MGIAPTEEAQGLAAEVGSADQSVDARDCDTWPVPSGESATFAAQAAVAAERARFAREMHDSVGKSLLGIAIAAASLISPTSPPDPHSLDQRLHDLARLAQHAVSETRSVINNLREGALGDAVRCMATAWGIAAGASISLAVAPGSDATEEIGSEIITILHEVLRNVEKHAHATQVQISLCKVAQGISLNVADNGVGFCPPADLRELESAGRRGLVGIAECAQRVGGVLVIESRPGLGARIVVQVPVSATGGRQSLAVPPPVARVIVAEDNPVLRSGLRAVLESAPEVEIVAEAVNGTETVDQVRRHGPDVLLFDACMRMADGSEVIPRVSRLTQVVVLTCGDDGSLAARTVGANEHRYAALGEFEPADLIQIVLDAARHKPVRALHTADPEDRSQHGNGMALRRRGGELTPREREVMGLIADGLSNRQIAARLVISEKTVKNHICSIYQRIGVCGRSQAVSRWREL
jgi:DNA-binding NarL/FixJ family response regulator/two-component sensor histidine kinase